MSKVNCVACRSADDEINERHVCPHCNGFAYFLLFPRNLRLQVLEELYKDPSDLEFLSALNLPEDIPTIEKCLNALGNQTPYTTVQWALAWRLVELRKMNERDECKALFRQETERVIKDAQESLHHTTKTREKLERKRDSINEALEEVKRHQEKYMNMMERAIAIYEEVEQILS